jgi:hypothetical protein
MALGQGPVSALDIRLLDACGDVVASGLCRGVQGLHLQPAAAAASLSPESLAQAATAAYAAALAEFDLLGQGTRQD